MKTRTKQQPFLMRVATTALALAQATRRATAALALILLTATTAWAQTPNGNWDTWVNDNNIDWNNAEAKAAAIPQSDDGSTVYISTAEQLAYYAYAVNNDKQISGSASGYYCGRTVELLADIDLSEHYWKPIGWNKDYYFSGYFHGNGHVITGIHVNGDPKSDKTNYYPCYGLFGYFHTRSSGTSTITDLVLKDFSITVSYSGSNSDEFYLGGLVGRCDDNTAITNCLLVNGSVSKSGNNSHAHIGKVSGAGSPSAATANYYHNVSVSGWYSGYDSYALQTIGGETEARAVALTVSGSHGSVALGGTVGRISGGIIYAPANETVTLNTTTDAGYIASLAATGLTLTSGQFTMPDNDDATITATISIDPAQFSQSGDTYTIHTAGGWNVFCDALQDNDTYNRFSGKTVRLADDITVSRMAGSGDNPFCGNFDGGGNTLTFTATAADNYCAPFVGVKGGTTADDATTISNLNVVTTITANDYRHMAGLIALQWGHVNVSGCNATVNISSTVGDNNPHDLYPAALVSQASSSDGGTLTVTGCTASGTISTDGKYAAGLVGIVQGTASIDNCRVSVTIQSTTSGDGTHGGLVASQPSKTTITITGCLFDGRLLGSATNKCGGFIGWRGGTATIYNSLFAPTEVTVQNEGSATFARNTTDTYNCYYTTLFNDGTNYAPALADGTVSPAKWHNGKATRSVTAGTDVILYSPGPLDNTNTYYNVSGIRAYTTGGLYYNHNLYYGSGDRLSILLGNTRDDEPLGYRYTYAFSGGTADEYEYSADDGETSYHLTMPDADVTVSLDTEHLAPIDWATVNQGNSTDPYMIYNKDQLLLLAHRVNGTHGETLQEDGYKNKYFKLGADITYDPQELTIDNDNDGTNDSNYEAIGGYYDLYRYFNGNFNGDNKTISGIRIYKGGTNWGDWYQGLFGMTDSKANIHDVTLANADITGGFYTGGIVGENQGTVSNCHVAASVIVRAVQNEAHCHGGIVGRNRPSGTVSSCTSSATLAVADGVTDCQRYGGIAGFNEGSLTDNLAIGATVPAAAYNTYGAISGNIAGSMARNYYRACTVANTENATGVGCNKSDVTDDNGAVPVYTLDLSTGITTTSEPVINYDNTDYYAGTITLSGGLPDDAPEHYTNAYTVNGNAISGNTFAINADATVGTGLYPADWATESEGSEGAPYMIYNKDQLDLLAHRVNGTHGETANDYENKYFKLGADIIYDPQELTIDNDNDGTNDSNYEAIGVYNDLYRYFNGNFDGGGHTVSGIRIYSGGTFAYSCQGLFGITGSSANIHDVTLADADITGDIYTGGIVGENQGTVSNCHVAASVIVRAVQDGAYQHGGIVGRNRTSGTVTHCTSAATLTIADGVTDCQYYGGIAGVNEGSLTDNLATGAVVPAAAYNTYGAISGVYDGTLQHNYYTACTLANVKNATGKGCGGIYDGGDYTVADITDDDGAVPAMRDNADNSTAIGLFAALASTTDNHTPVDLGWGEGQFPLQLAGRTLYKDGDWNTLCLPFDVTIANSPLAGDGVDVRTLDNTDFSNGTLTLDFTDKDAVTTLKAGKPYIVRWDKPDNYVAYDGTNAAECSDLVNPVFNGVTVSTATANVETDCVDFIGILSPTVLYEDGAEKTNLYMGAANKLYYPTVEGFKLNACRGYFKLKGVVVNGNGNDNGNENAIRSFDINFGEETTGVALMDNGKLIIDNEAGAWYDLSGRKLSVSSDSSVPSVLPKGIYIHNGNKVVIK